MAYGGGDPWRLVLLGKTGVGKSAAGNTILGDKVLKSESRPTSVTSTCSDVTRVIDGKTITIIDTPGLYDTSMSNDYIVKELVKGVQLAAPGPHAFLLVTDTRRFTEEEKNTVRKFQEIFGDGVRNHMIVLFTRGDDLEFDNKTVETFIKEAGPDLSSLISACGGRYHLFNNRKTDCTQVKSLFQKIYIMLSYNNHSYYSYELFTMAQLLKEEREAKKTLQAKMQVEVTPRLTQIRRRLEPQDRVKVEGEYQRLQEERIATLQARVQVEASYQRFQDQRIAELEAKIQNLLRKQNTKCTIM